MIKSVVCSLSTCTCKLRAYMYSTDHKQLNARSRLTREGGVRACERSMQHSRVAYEYSRTVYECMHASAHVCNDRLVPYVHVCTCTRGTRNLRMRMSERSTSAREQSTRTCDVHLQGFCEHARVNVKLLVICTVYIFYIPQYHFHGRRECLCQCPYPSDSAQKM